LPSTTFISLLSMHARWYNFLSNKIDDFGGRFQMTFSFCWIFMEHKPDQTLKWNNYDVFISLGTVGPICLFGKYCRLNKEVVIDSTIITTSYWLSHFKSSFKHNQLIKYLRLYYKLTFRINASQTFAFVPISIFVI